MDSAKYNSAMGALGLVAWTTDDVGQQFSCGDVLAELLGTRPATASEFIALVHADDRDGVSACIRDVTSDGAALSFRLIDASGDVAWVSGRCAVLGGATPWVAFAGRNVTEDRNLAESLDRSRAAFDGFAQNLPGAIFRYTLRPDGTDSAEFLNEGCSTMWEVSREDALHDASVMWERIVREDLELVSESVARSAQLMEPWYCEFRVEMPDGTRRWIRAHALPEPGEAGVVKWYTLQLDVTAEREARDALASSLRSMVNVLAATVEARDPYTAGHEERVALLCNRIGRRLGLDEATLEGLELAARVHDVGKIKIPAELLSKPGRLSPAEYMLMKEHAVAGADILAGVDALWPIAVIIRQHHERFDGSGYPDGLAGEEITIEARIMGVADTVDAMASDRPYRRALGIDAALDEIRAGSGTRYDPRVADACLALAAERALLHDAVPQ